MEEQERGEEKRKRYLEEGKEKNGIGWPV